MDIRDKLIAAVTEYDRKQSTKKQYNRYALAQYLARVDEVMDDIANGASVRDAVFAGFVGQLGDACMRSLGLPIVTKDEFLNGPVCYKPVSKRKD